MAWRNDLSVNFYILDEAGRVVLAKRPVEWSRWFENNSNRIVGNDTFGDVRVSTVFLGIDHGFGAGPLVLWETMIFGGKLDGEQRRYTSREDAIRGHEEMCALVQGSL